MYWEGFVRKWSWPNLRYYSGICMEELREAMGNMATGIWDLSYTSRRATHSTAKFGAHRNVQNTLVPLLFWTNITVTQNLPKVERDGNEAIKTWQRRHTFPTCSLVFCRAVTFPAVRNTNTMTTTKRRETQSEPDWPMSPAAASFATPGGTATSYTNAELYRSALTQWFSNFVTPRPLNTNTNLCLPLCRSGNTAVCALLKVTIRLYGGSRNLHTSSFTIYPEG